MGLARLASPEVAMGSIRPGWSHGYVLHLEPTRRGATIANIVFALLATAVAVGALAYRTDAWPQEWRIDAEISDRAIFITAAVAGFLALLFVTGAIVNGRRWHISR